MTISTAATPLSYSGNGSVTEFAITWAYIAKSHIVATLRATDGTETSQVLNTDYTLTDPGATGTLTMTTAPATGETLVITLEPPNTQETDIPLGGSFPAKSVEDALDLASQVSQKFQLLFDRALRVPRTDTRRGSQLDLPNETDRASKFLAFDGNGDPIFSTGPTGDSSIPVSAFMETVLDDSTAEKARTTLGAAGLADNNTLSGDNTLSGASINHAVHTEAAHATTSDIWDGGNVCLLSGSAVTFTALAAAPQAGAMRHVVANAAHIFTDGATFEVDGNANYTCAAGDVLLITAKTTSTFRVNVISHGDRTIPITATATTEGIVELATEAEVKTGTDTSRVPSVSTMRTGLISSSVWTATAVNAKHFGGLPAWATEFNILFHSVSFTGTDPCGIRLGDSGGLHASGYSANAARHNGGGTTVSVTTTEFRILQTTAGGDINGVLTIRRRGTGVSYMATGQYRIFTTGEEYGTTQGVVDLNTVLTEIAVFAVGGGNFDGGAVTLTWR